MKDPHLQHSWPLLLLLTQPKLVAMLLVINNSRLITLEHTTVTGKPHGGDGGVRFNWGGSEGVSGCSGWYMCGGGHWRDGWWHLLLPTTSLNLSRPGTQTKLWVKNSPRCTVEDILLVLACGPEVWTSVELGAVWWVGIETNTKARKLGYGGGDQGHGHGGDHR